MLKFKLDDLKKVATDGSLEILAPNVFYQGKCLGAILGEDVYSSNLENKSVLKNLNLNLEEA